MDFREGIYCTSVNAGVVLAGPELDTKLEVMFSVRENEPNIRLLGRPNYRLVVGKFERLYAPIPIQRAKHVVNTGSRNAALRGNHSSGSC